MILDLVSDYTDFTTRHTLLCVHRHATVNLWNLHVQSWHAFHSVRIAWRRWRRRLRRSVNRPIANTWRRHRRRNDDTPVLVAW